MSNNYSLLAVPATWGIAIMAHWYAASLTFTSNDLPAFQNVHPRVFLAKCHALEKQSPVSRRLSIGWWIQLGVGGGEREGSA